MVCSKLFTFPYWFSHLRTRQKQLSLAPNISSYSRRGIVYGKALKWLETWQIMSWSWLSAWNWVIFFHMLYHWSRQLYYRTKLYEIALRKGRDRAEKYVFYLICDILNSHSYSGISFYYNLPENKHTKIFHKTNGSLAKLTSVTHRHWDYALCPELHVSLQQQQEASGSAACSSLYTEPL